MNGVKTPTVKLFLLAYRDGKRVLAEVVYGGKQVAQQRLQKFSYVHCVGDTHKCNILLAFPDTDVVLDVFKPGIRMFVQWGFEGESLAEAELVVEFLKGRYSSMGYIVSMDLIPVSYYFEKYPDLTQQGKDKFVNPVTVQMTTRDTRFVFEQDPLNGELKTKLEERINFDPSTDIQLDSLGRVTNNTSVPDTALVQTVWEYNGLPQVGSMGGYYTVSPKREVTPYGQKVADNNSKIAAAHILDLLFKMDKAKMQLSYQDGRLVASPKDLVKAPQFIFKPGVNIIDFSFEEADDKLAEATEEAIVFEEYTKNFAGVRGSTKVGRLEVTVEDKPAITADIVAENGNFYKEYVYKGDVVRFLLNAQEIDAFTKVISTYNKAKELDLDLTGSPDKVSRAVATEEARRMSNRNASIRQKLLTGGFNASNIGDHVNVSTSVSSAIEAGSDVENELQDSADKRLKLSLNTPGLTHAESGQVILLGGVYGAILGPYYCIEVEHLISSGHYITAFTGLRITEEIALKVETVKQTPSERNKAIIEKAGLMEPILDLTNNYLGILNDSASINDYNTKYNAKLKYNRVFSTDVDTFGPTTGTPKVDQEIYPGDVPGTFPIQESFEIKVDAPNTLDLLKNPR